MSILDGGNYPIIFKLLGGVKFMMGHILTLVDEQII